MSKCRDDLFKYRKASECTTAISCAANLLTPDSKLSTTALFRSTNTTSAAPREAASKPSAPLPAKRSRQRAPNIPEPNQLKSVSLTRPGVGRNPDTAGTINRRRFQRPAIICTLASPETWIISSQSKEMRTKRPVRNQYGYPRTFSTPRAGSEKHASIPWRNYREGMERLSLLPFPDLIQNLTVDTQRSRGPRLEPFDTDIDTTGLTITILSHIQRD